MNTKTNIIIRQALFLTLFFIAANILPPINILAVPITFQTLIIMLVPFIFTLKQSILWYLSLLLLTLIGIPMMAGFKSGLIVLLGPTAGFIYGWLIMIVVINLSLRYINNRNIRVLMMICSIIIALSLGGIGLSFFNELSIINNILICLASFLPIELIKLLIVKKVIKKIPVKYLNKGEKHGS